MKKYRASRFKQLIFPQELMIDKFHVLSRKRHFPAFWRVTEESIPLSKLASIQIHRGFLFSKLIIENSGGPYPIIVDGLWNNAASEARALLEEIERTVMRGEDISILVDETPDPKPGSPSSGGAYRPPSPTAGSGAGRTSEPSGSTLSPPSAGGRADSEETSNGASPRAEARSSRVTFSAQPELDFLGEKKPSEAVKAVCEMKMRSRRIGELPSEDWVPTPPWIPKSHSVEDDGCESPIRETHTIALMEKDDIERKNRVKADETSRPPSVVEHIVNWLEENKSPRGLSPSSRGRRRRKLN